MQIELDKTELVEEEYQDAEGWPIEVLRQLNDAGRKSIGLTEYISVTHEGKEYSIEPMFVMTSGIDALTPKHKLELMALVSSFDNFSEDNDPYGEHDMAFVDLGEKLRCFWKWDYYDSFLTYFGHEVHVLTIGLGSEY